MALGIERNSRASIIGPDETETVETGPDETGPDETGPVETGPEEAARHIITVSMTAWRRAPRALAFRRTCSIRASNTPASRRPLPLRPRWTLRPLRYLRHSSKGTSRGSTAQETRAYTRDPASRPHPTFLRFFLLALSSWLVSWGSFIFSFLSLFLWGFSLVFLFGFLSLFFFRSFSFGRPNGPQRARMPRTYSRPRWPFWIGRPEMGPMDQGSRLHWKIFIET